MLAGKMHPQMWPLQYRPDVEPLPRSVERIRPADTLLSLPSLPFQKLALHMIRAQRVTQVLGKPFRQPCAAFIGDVVCFVADCVAADDSRPTRLRLPIRT